MELRLNLIFVVNEFRIYKLDLKIFYYKVIINVLSLVGNLDKWKILLILKFMMFFIFVKKNCNF